MLGTLILVTAPLAYADAIAARLTFLLIPVGLFLLLAFLFWSRLAGAARYRPVCFILAAAGALWLLTVTAALAASTLIGQATGYDVDLSPVLNQVVWPTLGALMTVLMPMLVLKVMAWLHIKATAEQQKALTGAAETAVTYALNVAAAKGQKIGALEVHNEIVANAANYLSRQLPDTIQRLGLTPDQVANLVRARIEIQPEPAAADTAAQKS